MKLVIPYRLDPNNGYELRYAIRSMVKHFKPLSGVVLVGDCPKWFTGEHILCADIEGRKEYSIYNKLKQVKGIVLYGNDDFFALQDFSTDLPNYYKGLCSEYRGYDKKYKDLYNACPAGWLDFDCHCPMIIDTDKFNWLAADMPIKSIYGNTNNLPGIRITDVKFTDKITDLTGLPFFSTKETCDLSILSELYPDKSKYENDLT